MFPTQYRVSNSISMFPSLFFFQVNNRVSKLYDQEYFVTENATRAHKIKRAFSEMVIFAKPGEKNHHMHHPWARRALQDVILIESSSTVNSNSTSK